MKNPNTSPVLSLADKQRCTPVGMSGMFYPMVVQSYDSDSDTFVIAADTRYEDDERDTDFYDCDDFEIPVYAVHAITGADTEFTSLEGWVGHQFLMVGTAVNK